MIVIPSRPFYNENFSDRGGGIDFLGLGSVNLDILSTDLIPEINNATSDIGTYFLATWIPWKFEAICRKAGPKSFTLENFRMFRERVEVSLAVVMRDGSPAEKKFGQVQRRIGTDQKVKFPSDLTFKSAGRTEATSLYAAPLYGPSVRYLDLVGYAISQSGVSSGIPKTQENQEALLIAEHVDRNLRCSKHYTIFESLAAVNVTQSEIDDLGLNGLHPSYYRSSESILKEAFSTKLFASSSRRHTARLLVASLKEIGPADLDTLKDCWYADSKFGSSLPTEISLHRKKWALFMSRQYQRYVLELHLKVFEEGLKQGHNSIAAIVQELLRIAETKNDQSFFDLVRREAELASAKGESVHNLAKKWHETINQGHAAFEGSFLYDDSIASATRAVAGLARWYLRASVLLRDLQDGALIKIANAGSTERVSLTYLVGWLTERGDQPLTKVLGDFISNFVFAQHLRVALSRFDGRLQRIRFFLDDEGIVLTSAMTAREAGIDPYMMADRSFALACLLTDLGVLNYDYDKERFSAGMLNLDE